MECNICNSNLSAPLFVSAKGESLTSLCEVVEKEITVFLCPICSHVQTEVIGNLSDFYSSEYKISLDSEEDDQLYEVIDTIKIFRTQHQASTLLEKINFPKNSKVLDFGCAKSSTMRYLLERRRDIDVHLFDVSDMYIAFWKKFLPENKWATFSVPDEWSHGFDVVTSFFALEHVEEPDSFLLQIRKLLKPTGEFYCVIPNVLTNTIDFIVADHVNHFTKRSLYYLFSQTGFKITDFDTTSHRGTIIVTATVSHENVKLDIPADDFSEEIKNLAIYWKDAVNKIRSFESRANKEKKSAIYGSGFYGSFIATCLNDLSKVVCFVDQNPYLQGKKMFDLPVVSPNEVGREIEYIYVGLNPKVAEQAISEIESWKEQAHKYLFL